MDPSEYKDVFVFASSIMISSEIVSISYKCISIYYYTIMPF